jgi:hypothetical protein
MRVRPHQGIDPRWYEVSPLSKKPAGNFTDLIKRIRKFDRDSVALMASSCTWFSWSVGGKPSELDRILRIHALFIAALGLAKCAPEGRPPIDEASFRILIGELFNLPGKFPTDFALVENEMIPIREALEKYSSEYPQIAKIDTRNDERSLMVLLYLSRTALVQWDGFSFQMSDLVRPMLMYLSFKEIAIKRGFCTSERLNGAEAVFLGTTVERFFRSIWLIHTYISSAMNKEKPVPIPFEPKAKYLDEEKSKVLNLTNEDLEVVANRLAIGVSKYRDILKDIETLGPIDGIHSKALWTLFDNPLVHFDDSDPGTLFLVMSPWRLIRRLVTFISVDLISYLEDNNVLGARNRAYQLRGEAYEGYLFDVIREFGVKKADAVLPCNHTGLAVDFIWEDDTVLLLIEAKAKIRPNNDPTFLSSHSMIVSWSTACEAIEQAKSTLNALQSTKKVALVIATDEALAEQATQFLRAAKYWNFLDGTGIDVAVLCPTAQLESVIRNSSPSEIYASVLATWSSLDPFDIQAEIHNYEFFNPKDDEASLRHIEEGWEAIIPEFGMRHRR